MNRLDTLLATRPAQARLHRFREMLANPERWNLGATDQDFLRWTIEFIEAALEERTEHETQCSWLQWEIARMQECLRKALKVSEP